MLLIDRQSSKIEQKTVVETRREQVRAFHAQSLTNRQIAKHLGVHHAVVGSDLKKLELKSNGRTRGILLKNGDKGKCTRCGKWKPIIDFAWLRIKGQKYPYQLTACHACRYEHGVKYINAKPERFIRQRIKTIERCSKRKGIAFNLTVEWAIDLLNKQNWRCFYTDIELKGKVGSGILDNSISFDKVIPEKGYIIGNVVICTRRINTIKNNLTLDEMRQWMPTFYERLVRGGFVTGV